jgi:NAD(P)-dependent dehydrogenase (short-subunit alcohol dehydrogenase family)
MIMRMWRRLKVWRRVRVGRFALFFSFRRVVPVTRGTWGRRQAMHSLRHQPLKDSNLEKRELEVNCETAVIVGVGPGFGYALARKLALAGFDIALISRDANRLAPLCSELRSFGVRCESYGMDATHELDVRATFERLTSEIGEISLVVYSLQEFGPGNTLNISAPAFESAWRHNCFGAFLVARAAGQVLQAKGQGSIFLVGSTSSIIGRAGHLNLAVGKFGQRALAQVMARELWPCGVHVAHVMIDADIAEEGVNTPEEIHSNPDDIAYSILALHQQPSSAWSSEVDLRPWNEKFWEHC